MEAELPASELSWWRREMHSYWQQYTHIWQSLQVMLTFEQTHVGVRHAYLARVRHDITYVDTFSPAWLETMPCDALAVASTEFHMRDRWMERSPPLWPAGVSDQLVFGPRAPMSHFAKFVLSQAGSERTLVSDRPPNIESLLAEHLIDANVSVITVELRFRQPGSARSVRCPACGNVSSPCRYCWDPHNGTTRAGVQDQLCALMPRAKAAQCDEAQGLRHERQLHHSCQAGIRRRNQSSLMRWIRHESYVMRACAYDFLHFHPAAVLMVGCTLAVMGCGCVARRVL